MDRVGQATELILFSLTSFSGQSLMFFVLSTDAESRSTDDLFWRRKERKGEEGRQRQKRRSDLSDRRALDKDVRSSGYSQKCIQPFVLICWFNVSLRSPWCHMIYLSIKNVQHANQLTEETIPLSITHTHTHTYRCIPPYQVPRVLSYVVLA